MPQPRRASRVIKAAMRTANQTRINHPVDS